MKSILSGSLAALALLAACNTPDTRPAASDSSAEFVRIDGRYLIEPSGDTLFIRGTNLGNWLNPEGYMFGFSRVNSAGMINQMLCELVGEQAAADFWQNFKDNYITRQDIDFIASTGANTIRLPFHYKLFTDEDFMGLTSDQDGFARVDSVVAWCKANGLYLILDMHDAPGGQTGDNIDDSFGYPFLQSDPRNEAKFYSIWKEIATRYADEPTILGYELMNEPVAPYFGDRQDELNAATVRIMRQGADTIRSVDPNHIILVGATQWNGNFEPLRGKDFGPRVMFTCHRYGGDPTPEAIGNFIAFRDSADAPMYMGEIGHNTDQWQETFVHTMEDADIGYTFWPYKKVDSSCFVGFDRPEGWEKIVEFAEGPRGSYAEIRQARPDMDSAVVILNSFVENAKFANANPQTGYIRSMHLKAPADNAAE